MGVSIDMTTHMTELDLVRWARVGVQAELARVGSMLQYIEQREAELNKPHPLVQVAISKPKLGRRKLSKEARASIAAAQKKRWAKFHKTVSAKKKGRPKKSSSVTHLPGDDNR